MATKEMVSQKEKWQSRKRSKGAAKKEKREKEKPWSPKRAKKNKERKGHGGPLWGKTLWGKPIRPAPRFNKKPLMRHWGKLKGN
jgi:hypothetical protein